MSNHENQCGLWKKDGNNGPYYSGKITVGGVEYWANLYKNDRKETDKHPDLNLKLKPVEGSNTRTAQSRTPPQSQPTRQARVQADDFQDSEIPF